jgi:hypothetical protein
MGAKRVEIATASKVSPTDAAIIGRALSRRATATGDRPEGQPNGLSSGAEWQSRSRLYLAEEDFLRGAIWLC